MIHNNNHISPEQGTFIPPQPLSTITHAEDYIVREHFEEFRELYRPTTAKYVATMAFYNTVDPRPLRMVSVQPCPRTRGRMVVSKLEPPTRIMVRSRDELGIAAARVWHNNVWNDHKSQYGIAVASFIDYSHHLPPTPSPRIMSVHSFIQNFASTLENQIILQESA